MWKGGEVVWWWEKGREVKVATSVLVGRVESCGMITSRAPGLNG